VLFIAEGCTVTKFFKGENVFKMNILVKDNIENRTIEMQRMRDCEKKMANQFSD